MCLLAFVNAFHLRVSLNVAITEMVAKRTNDINSTHYDPNACPDDDDLPGSGNGTSSPKPNVSGSAELHFLPFLLSLSSNLKVSLIEYRIV